MDNRLAERLDNLLPAIAKGDRRAFEQLYRLTSPHLFALALRMLRQQGWAEEVLHDCYLTIWNRAASYDAALSAPMTWMTHIVRNRCIDGLRSGQARLTRRQKSLATCYPSPAKTNRITGTIRHKPIACDTALAI